MTVPKFDWMRAKRKRVPKIWEKDLKGKKTSHKTKKKKSTKT